MKKVTLFAMLFLGLSVVAVKAENVSATGSGRRMEFKELKKQTNEEFRAKLQTIKDEKKKVVVARMNDQLCMVQKKRADAMQKSVDMMTRILAKVTAKLNGSPSEAVNVAETARLAARDAVTVFAARTCGVTLSGDPTKVRTEVQVARLALETDAKTAQEKIKSARKLTSDAVRSVAVIVGDRVPEGLNR